MMIGLARSSLYAGNASAELAAARASRKDGLEAPGKSPFHGSIVVCRPTRGLRRYPNYTTVSAVTRTLPTRSPMFENHECDGVFF
jgi:hypothetical protein